MQSGRMMWLRPCLAMALVLCCGLLWPAWASAKIEIEVTATEPEYMGQDRAIWDLYEEENPNVSIKITPINEDTEAAYQTRVAAGDPADIRTNIFFPNKDNYQVYANLLTLPVTNWDYLTYDGKKVFEYTSGVKDYAPSFNVQLGPFRTFVFYADEMRKAGLDPKKTVKTLADLDDFLAKLHAYVKSRPDLQYTLDAGWSANAWGRNHLDAVAVATGGTKEQMRQVFRGQIKWTDLQKNPYVPALKKMREWYEKGYLPPKWWTRAWETEYEAGFIAKKSILAFHGPWLFDKTLAQRPDAELDGFLLPPNQEKHYWAYGATADYGGAIYVAATKKPHFNEILKAFNWWNSPATVKLRAEAVGFIPAMDLSSVGGADIKTAQYKKVLEPVLKGQGAGGATFDMSVPSINGADMLKKKGTPHVMADNAAATLFGDYYEGRISIEQLMEKFQERWNYSYGP